MKIEKYRFKKITHNNEFSDLDNNNLMFKVNE